MCSLGIEPTTFCAADAMLYHWATQEQLNSLKVDIMVETPYRFVKLFCVHFVFIWLLCFQKLTLVLYHLLIFRFDVKFDGLNKIGNSFDNLLMMAYVRDWAPVCWNILMTLTEKMNGIATYYPQHIKYLENNNQ